jgi:hypothetical protein
MTVGELKGILSMYPDKMLVPTGFAEIVSDDFPVLLQTVSRGPAPLSNLSHTDSEIQRLG